jgi:predicted nucleotidyltransferase
VKLRPAYPQATIKFKADQKNRYKINMKDNLLDKTLEILSSLNEEKVEYIVIGGVALNLHGLIRATEDLDLFLRPQPENISALRHALKRVWNDPEIDLITDEDLCGSYPAVRYGPPDETLPLDILTRLGEFARYEDLEYEIIELENVHIRVATPKTLLWLKANIVRPQDKADAEALCLAFDLKVEDEK